MLDQKVSITKTNNQIFIKLFAVLVIAFLCLSKVNSLDSYPTGDGPEYILTTEAFYRHCTPDLRAKDSRLFKKAYIKRSKWENIYKAGYFDEFEAFLNKPNKQFRENLGGAYVAFNNKIYGYHFPSYSLINVPARYFIGLLNKNPLAAFKYTNAFLIIITCSIILFLTPFNTLHSILIAFSFLYSSVYWYIGWTHPEVFTVCLVTISLWGFFQHYNYLPLLLISFAATQNQPLVFFVVLMAATILYRNGFNVKTVIKTGLCASMVLIPALFYYYHFHSFSLINDEGFLDAKNQTFTRIFGFYFDINQGIILAIPLILILYVLLVPQKIYQSIKNRTGIYLDFFVLVSLSALTLTLVTMINWNHGQAVINRYASWVSAIIFVHFFFLLKNSTNMIKSFAIALIFLSQIATTLYHETLNIFDLTLNQHKPIAHWILKNYPSLYNPDPTIFGIRTTNGYNINPETSPIVYFDEKNEVCKIMCLKDNLDELYLYGVNLKDIQKFKSEKKSSTDWVYINRGDYTPYKNAEEVYNFTLYKKAKNIIVPQIRNRADWYAQIKEKAKVWNVSEDSALVIDALYVLNQEKNKK